MSLSPQPSPSAQPREWANATPAGLVALAVACFCFFALLNGYVGGGALPLLAGWLVGGFIIQIVVALVDLKSGNLAGGNTFLFFCAFFMLVCALGFIMKSQLTGLDARVDGWAWLALTLVVWLWTPAFFKSPAMLTIVVLTLDVALPCLTLKDLGVFADAGVNKTLAGIAGWALLASGCSAIYLASATILNGTFGKRVLPNPGPLYKEKANVPAAPSAKA